MINTAPPVSNSVYGRGKLFWYGKINFSDYRVSLWCSGFLERADKPAGSTPGDAVFCFKFVPFFLCLVSFLTLFFLLAFLSLLLMLSLLVMHLDQYIFYKQKSGLLFWKRDFKSSLSAYWPSLRPDKNHKLSRHVPPLKQLNFFQC